MWKLILTIFCLSVMSCGTIGHLTYYKFEVSKTELENNINRTINNNQQFNIPKTSDLSWAYYITKWEQKTSNVIYIKDTLNNELLYMMSICGDSLYWKSNLTNSKLALVAIKEKRGAFINKGSYFWFGKKKKLKPHLKLSF